MMHNKFLHPFAVLLLIVAVGIVVRVYQFSSLPFSHDEFSALHRTGYATFGELLAKGVRTDAHPAFAQVLVHYTTKIFGASAVAVKAPFLLLGIACLPLIFWLVKLWGSQTAALFATASMATLQYPIMYSTLARPYGSGLFFSLLLLIFWTKILRKPKIVFDATSIGFVLSAALSAHNHHFGLLFGGLVGLAGLLLVQKRNRLRYVLLGGFVMVLYLPYVPIFLVQLQKGGVAGWLAKPTNDFLWQYLRYIFHFHWAPAAAAVLVMVVPFVMRQQFHQKRNFYLVWGFLFLMPFAIGFLYSTYINAVLQYSVLIFSFPALLLLLFAGVPQLGQRATLGGVLLLLTVNLATLIVVRQHFTVFYKSFYAHTFLDAKAVPAQVSTAYFFAMPDKIAQHYQQEIVGLPHFINLSAIDFPDWLEKNHLTVNQIFIGADAVTNPQLLAWAQRYFPIVSSHQTYFTGDTYLLKRGPHKAPAAEVAWANTTSQQEFSEGLDLDLEVFVQHPNDFVDVWAVVPAVTIAPRATLVVEVLTAGAVVHWQGQTIMEGQTTEGGLVCVNTLKLADLPTFKKGSRLRAYIWKPDLAPIPVASLAVYTRAGNPVVYSWYHPIYSKKETNK